MINSGLIENLVVDGYERIILLSFFSTNKKYWIYLVQHEEFLEAGETSNILQVGQSVKIEISIDLVNEYLVIDRAVTSEGVIQPIEQSSYTIANGVISKILDEFSVLCDIEGFGKAVLVEFESKLQVKSGDFIKIKGNMKGQVVNETDPLL